MLQRSNYVLGKGGCATVYLGRIVHESARSPDSDHGDVVDNSYNAGLVAVKKRFRAACTSPGQRMEAEHEIMTHIPPHPNVMAVSAACVIDDHTHYAMPLMDSDLGFEIKKQRLRASECQCLVLVRDILQALHHIHQHGVAHRDVKPSNALLKRNPNTSLGVSVILGDFGVAHRTEAEECWASNMCGTRPYQSPEQLSNRLVPRQAASCDSWAAGCVLFELLTGEVPFGSAASALEALRIILTSFGITMENYLWNTDRAVPTDRTPAIFSHPRISTLNDATRDLLYGLLRPDPSFRLTCGEALRHAAFTDVDQRVTPLTIRGYDPLPNLLKVAFVDLKSMQNELGSTAQKSRDMSTGRRSDNQPAERCAVADGRRVTLGSTSTNLLSRHEFKETSPSPQSRTLNFDDSDDDI